MNWLREDKEIFIGKLNYLKNYYEELKSFESLVFPQYIEDKIKRRAIERLLQLIVEVACDINSFILSKKGIVSSMNTESIRMKSFTKTFQFLLSFMVNI
jgi:uncharacterized protein YutE (UPF0331/DUF86 family)